MQDLNDMLFFAEVAERGGFAAAGRALGLPTSRLSRRVAELEGRLGVRLLQRTTRRIALTDVGAQYLRHCVAVREEAQAAADVVALVHTEPRGVLRVSCPVTLAQTIVGEVVAPFMARYPEVRVDIAVTNRVVNLVEEGIDVALRVRPTLEDSGSLVVKRLGNSQTLLVGTPGQLDRQGGQPLLATWTASAPLRCRHPTGARVGCCWARTVQPMTGRISRASSPMTS
jgi:DNA-binding transcriptional LysR family regulator